MGLLNNREIAFAIWFSLLVMWLLSNKEIRSAFGSVLDCFSKKVIIIPFSLLVLHTLASVWLLSEMGIWDLSQAKNTVFWFFSVAAVSLFRLNKIADDRHYFKSAVKDNLKIIVLLQFLISYYTFSIFVELIFVPFMALLGGLLAVSQKDEKHLLVHGMLNKLIEILGLAVIVYAAYRMVRDFQEFAQFQTFLDLAVPISLSILLLPLIYLFHVYMVYELVFVGIQFSVKDEKVRAYAKRSAILKYKLNVLTLRRWADALSRENVVDSSDVDEVHKEIARLEAEEKNPPEVPFDQGWSPYKIAPVLECVDLNVGHYKKLYQNQWFASSPYIKIGEGFIANTIAYCIEGDIAAVKQLKLKADISEPEKSAEAHQFLCDLAALLHLQALGVEMGKGFKNAIIKGSNKEGRVNTKMVRVSTDSWPNNRGYDIKFTISNF